MKGSLIIVGFFVLGALCVFLKASACEAGSRGASP